MIDDDSTGSFSFRRGHRALTEYSAFQEVGLSPASFLE
jgi:hypothetical protein